MATRRNPLAGVAPHQFSAAQLDDAPTICSTFTGEQLAGTAKPGTLILALEYYTGWGRDILDGTALGPELNAQVKDFLKANNAELQFIRRPGREGQNRKNNPTRVLYIAWAKGTDPVLERIDLPSVEALLDLDLSQPGNTPGARRVDHPILLVCTHGKRDRCCAVRGRPLAAALNDHFSACPTAVDMKVPLADEDALVAEAEAAGLGAGPLSDGRSFPDATPSTNATNHNSAPVDSVDPVIWESSHTKGHRFAPSMLLLPANYSFGRMALNGATALVEHAQRGEMWLQGNRGRGSVGPASQSAQMAVAQELHRRGLRVGLAALESWEISDAPDDARGGTVGVRGGGSAGAARGGGAVEVVWRGVKDNESGLQFTVRLEHRDSVMVVSSCGDKPKRAKSWVVVDLQEAAVPAR